MSLCLSCHSDPCHLRNGSCHPASHVMPTHVTLREVAGSIALPADGRTSLTLAFGSGGCVGRAFPPRIWTMLHIVFRCDRPATPLTARPTPPPQFFPPPWVINSPLAFRSPSLGSSVTFCRF